MGALTGPDAQLGINIYNGAKLAIDEHNAKSGAAKVTLKQYDTQGDPTQASSQARKVIQDKDVAVVGPAFSGESKTADPILEAAKIPYVSASATAVTLAQNGWKFFHRALANDDVQGPGDADYMVKTLGVKHIAVIDDQSEYGKGLGDAVRAQLKKDGATVVYSGTIDPKGSDYSTTVNAASAKKPDAIFFGGYYSAAAKLVKQLRDSSVKATFVSGDGSLDQKIADQGGAAANGALLSCTCSSAVGSTVPAVQKFEKAYVKAFKSEPATYSAEGYDVTNLILAAIDGGKTTPDAINSYVTSVNYQGVSKPIKFASDGNLSGNLLFISEVVNGKLKFLGPTSKAKPVAAG
ncbi:MAG: branched-chain amino acid ABC transporter substrate-binding protein [Mycobacteriales bacterium]